MEPSAHIDQLRADGVRLAEAATVAGLDAAVPTCPEWVVRDLVLHQGRVHRWAGAHVAGARQEPIDDGELDALAGTPGDDELIEWFRAGHAELVETLSNADPALECWHFLPAPSALAFWARRQAHETAIHRVDAESVRGVVEPFAPEFAADGIDELLTCFVPRGSKLRSDEPRSITIRATDAAPGTTAAWHIQIGAGKPEVVREDRTAGCTIAGAATDLYVFLWNRGTADRLAVEGDRSALGYWADTVAIRWS